jgi:hypothetical protein
MSAWQPIETAPRDGTSVDLWVDGEFPHRIANAEFREPTDGEWWAHGGDTIDTPDATWCDMFGPLGKEEQPTHWQPLPEAPVSHPSDTQSEPARRVG